MTQTTLTRRPDRPGEAPADGRGGSPSPRARNGIRAGIGPWMLLPAGALLAVFLYGPLVTGVRLSLFGTDLFGDPTRFVGLQNYLTLLAQPSFWQVVGTTLLIATLSMSMSVGVALTAVILLRKWIPGRGVLRVVFSLPFAYSAASASAIFSGMFAPAAGVVNQILGHAGIGAVPWLQQPGWAIFTIALTTAWYELGFAFLVLAAAMRTLPPEVIEAAELDGASGLRFVRSILVPLLSPSLFFLLVTQTISGLQTFTQVRILTGGGPAGGTTTLVYQLYMYAFGQGTPDYGRASVVAVVLVLIVALVTWLQFRFINRRVTA